MGSWIVCRCGERIGTNLFSGQNVHRVICDGDYDGVTDPVDRDQLERLFVGGRTLLECRRCGRIFIRARGATEYTVYAREA